MLVIRGEISELCGFEALDLESQAKGGPPPSTDTCDTAISPAVHACSPSLSEWVFQEKYLILLSWLLESAFNRLVTIMFQDALLLKLSVIFGTPWVSDLCSLHSRWLHRSLVKVVLLRTPSPKMRIFYLHRRLSRTEAFFFNYNWSYSSASFYLHKGMMK